MDTCYMSILKKKKKFNLRTSLYFFSHFFVIYNFFLGEKSIEDTPIRNALRTPPLKDFQ